MKLVIGNKNYSTWSLRPWLLLKSFNIPFEEQWVSLQQPGLSERLKAFSGSCKVPVLIDQINQQHQEIWDSLAICEYLNEHYLDGKGWPKDKADRALAKSIVAEMHGGFFAVRNGMPMNIRQMGGKRKIEVTDAIQKDINRIDEIWSLYSHKRKNDANNHPEATFLFGEFSIADCFFAPVVTRFSTYGIQVSDKSKHYMNSILNHPSMKEWIEEACKEDEIIDEDEAGIPQ